MKEDERLPAILTINAGSSSVKFAVFLIADHLNLFLQGQVKHINTDHAFLQWNRKNEERKEEISFGKKDSIAQTIINIIENELTVALIAVTHRIVHGMRHSEPELITPKLIDELNEISFIDPDHLPAEIEFIQQFQQRYPHLKHIACFDTAFHSTMPGVAKWIPIPWKFYAKGIHRYGFHGLSYSFLIEELQRKAGKKVASGKVVLAHLGSGASLAAVKEGTSIDTSMGFTPTSGIPMGTRSGDFDPGVVNYLMKKEHLSIDQINDMLNHESGLKGISQRSGDMQELLERENNDLHAKNAIELFCYQTRKYIGAMAAALGGLEALVFSGGMGEQSPAIRERICMNLEFLGIQIDTERNRSNDFLISNSAAKVAVYVIPTNEEVMMARLTQQLIARTN